MIAREYYKTRLDGVKLYRSYSDSGRMLLQNETGILYVEAVDVENTGYTYSETEVSAEDPELTAEEALEIITGGDGNA